MVRGKVILKRPGGGTTLLSTFETPGVQKDRVRFPKTPGTIILFLGIPVNQQDLLPGECTGIDHMHDQAQPGTPCACNDIIVLPGMIQKNIDESVKIGMRYYSSGVGA